MTEEKQYVQESICKIYRENILREIENQVSKLELLSGKAQEDFRRTLERIAKQIDKLEEKKILTKEEILDIFQLWLNKLSFKDLSPSVQNGIKEVLDNTLINFRQEFDNFKIETIVSTNKPIEINDLKKVLPDALNLIDLSLVKIINSRHLKLIILGIGVLIINIIAGWSYINYLNSKIIDNTKNYNINNKAIIENTEKVNKNDNIIKTLIRQNKAVYLDYCERNKLNSCE